MHYLLGILQTLFSIWMLVDAIRYKTPVYWWFIVMVPFGEVAYFFAVFLPNRKIRPMDMLRDLGSRVVVLPANVGQAEALAHEVPSDENKLALARAYAQNGRNSEALPLFEAYVERHPLEIAPRHALASSLLLLDRMEEAVPHLARVVELDRTWRDFSATFELARTYRMVDRPDEAKALLEATVRGSHRIAPAIELAAHLKEVGDRAGARRQLEQALRDYERSPDSIRVQDQWEAARAKTLLKSL